MGIAHGGADILVAEQFLDFSQILSHLVEEDRGRGVAQPMRGDLPYPEGSTGGEDTKRNLKHAKRLRRSHVHGCGAAKFIWTEGRRCVPVVIAG